MSQVCNYGPSNWGCDLVSTKFLLRESGDSANPISYTGTIFPTWFQRNLFWINLTGQYLLLQCETKQRPNITLLRLMKFASRTHWRFKQFSCFSSLIECFYRASISYHSYKWSWRLKWGMERRIQSLEHKNFIEQLWHIVIVYVVLNDWVLRAAPLSNSISFVYIAPQKWKWELSRRPPAERITYVKDNIVFWNNLT